VGSLWAAGALCATLAGDFSVRAAREGAHNVGAPSSPLPKTEAAEMIFPKKHNPALEEAKSGESPDGRPVPRGVYRPQGFVSPLLRPDRATVRPRQPMCA